MPSFWPIGTTDGEARPRRRAAPPAAAPAPQPFPCRAASVEKVPALVGQTSGDAPVRRADSSVAPDRVLTVTRAGVPVTPYTSVPPAPRRAGRAAWASARWAPPAVTVTRSAGARSTP